MAFGGQDEDQGAQLGGNELFFANYGDDYDDEEQEQDEGDSSPSSKRCKDNEADGLMNYFSNDRAEKYNDYSPDSLDHCDDVQE